MASHILLEKASVYPIPKGRPKMKYCRYDPIAGIWYMETSFDREEPYIRAKDPCRPRPTTKKADVETGEDQKSE